MTVCIMIVAQRLGPSLRFDLCVVVVRFQGVGVIGALQLGQAPTHANYRFNSLCAAYSVSRKVE